MSIMLSEIYPMFLDLDYTIASVLMSTCRYQLKFFNKNTVASSLALCQLFDYLTYTFKNIRGLLHPHTPKKHIADSGSILIKFVFGQFDGEKVLFHRKW